MNKLILYGTLVTGLTVFSSSSVVGQSSQSKKPRIAVFSGPTATKARLLLKASLLKFGSLPPANDPSHPTPAEKSAVLAKLAQYQEVFDAH